MLAGLSNQSLFINKITIFPMQFYHNIEILSTEKHSILIELRRHYLTVTPGFSICAGIHPFYPVKPVYKKILKKSKKRLTIRPEWCIIPSNKGEGVFDELYIGDALVVFSDIKLLHMCLGKCLTSAVCTRGQTTADLYDLTCSLTCPTQILFQGGNQNG